jgi:hypothetical protein
MPTVTTAEHYWQSIEAELFRIAFSSNRGTQKAS